jgi:hypothetical protein
MHVAVTILELSLSYMLASIIKLTHRPKKLPQITKAKDLAKQKIVRKAVKRVREVNPEGGDIDDLQKCFKSTVTKLVEDNQECFKNTVMKLVEEYKNLDLDVELKGTFSEVKPRSKPFAFQEKLSCEI